MPRPPSSAARFGTRFHAWVEARFGQQLLLDPDELPGRGDSGIDDDSDLRELIKLFEDGPFADRVPHAVEPPFALVLAGQVVRGRIDAVYTEPSTGRRLTCVVDWKTNRAATADPLQLAIYRVAWAELHDVPVERVRAAFYYVRTGELVEPDGPARTAPGSSGSSRVRRTSGRLGSAPWTSQWWWWSVPDPGSAARSRRLFAREGYDVGLVGVHEPALAELREAIAGRRRAAPRSPTSPTPRPRPLAIRTLGDHFGRIDVLHFNPSAFREKDPLELTVAELLQDVALGVGALLTAVQAARPYLSAGGRVTVTGSMAADEPWNRAASLGVQKAGVRNLVHSLDATLEPDGIRAVSVTVRGTLGEGGPVHTRPGRRGDPRRGVPGRGRVAVEVPYAG